MKKILCLVIALLMLMSPTVFAGSADEIAKMYLATSKVSSASGKIILSTSLNEPLELLGTIPVEDDVEIDYQLLIEELIGATAEIEYAYSISNDKKKMDLSLNMVLDAPIALNDDFRIDAWAKIGAWLQYDISDLSNPTYKMIFKVPFEKNYIVMDFSDVIQENPALSFLDTAATEQMQEEIMDALLRYANVKKKGFEYIISLDDTGARAYLVECIALYQDYMKRSNTSNMESYIAADKLLQNIADALKNTPLLGEQGLELKLVKNSMGLVSAEVEKLHLNFNVYDLLVANGKSTDGLKQEQGKVNLTLESSVSIEKHNHTSVTIPQLTDENSEVIFQDLYGWNTSLIAKKPPVFRNNCIYFPIESMAEQVGKPLSIEKNGETATITYSNEHSITVSGNSIFYSDEETLMDAPAIIAENDGYYCLEELLYPLNIVSAYVLYDVDNHEFYISFEVFPDAESESESDYEYEPEYEENSYVPMQLHYGFSLDRSLYQEDSILFMPVYEFVSTLFPGEFRFGNHSITYTALEENPFGIQTISAVAGDTFVTINGEQRALTHSVVEVNGILNIPFSFAKELGLDGGAEISHRLWDNDFTSYCHFYMDNPDYHEEDFFDEYVPEQLYFWVSSDQVPCVENGEVYVPLYDLLQEMFEGEFTFFENGLEYVASGENNLQIEMVSACLGDNYVTVDGEKIGFEHEIITVNDIIRVPMSFTRNLGMENEGITAYYGTTYCFVMDNPSYQPIDDGLLEKNNWFYSLFQ